MRRLFWAALGAAAGVALAGRIARTARGFTPAGMADTTADFVGAVRRDMALREDELRQEFGMPPSPDAGIGTVTGRKKRR